MGEQKPGRRHEASIDWRLRHVVVILAGIAGTYGFLESRADWSAMHRWNRAIGDMGFVMIALVMAIGPICRLFPVFRWMISWRRELGLYGVVLMAVHTAVIIVGWVEWDLARLFGFELHPISGIYVMLQHGFGLANIIGIICLIYGLILAASSNDLSQRLLGGASWKFLQQGAYVLWMLAVVHTGYFLFIHFLSFHRQMPDANWVQGWFSAVVGIITALQIAAFIMTWRRKRRFSSAGRQRPMTLHAEIE